MIRLVAALVVLSAATAFSPAAPLALQRQTLRRAGEILTVARRPRAAAGRSLALRMQSKDNNGEDALDRFVACLPYALPLADSFEWGHYLFDSFPLLAIPFLPLFPVIQLLNLPFVSFGIFIVLFSFVARNPSFSRLVRFNTLQVVPPSACPALSSLVAVGIYAKRSQAAPRLLSGCTLLVGVLTGHAHFARMWASVVSGGGGGAGSVLGRDPHLPATPSVNCGPDQPVYPRGSRRDRCEHRLLRHLVFLHLLVHKQRRRKDAQRAPGHQ